MESLYYTQSGPRPDLAAELAAEVNPPEGYIGAQIVPVSPVLDKSGIVYYKSVTADQTAETGRDPGVAPTATRIATNNTTYTTAERIRRGNITPDEAKQFGGIDKADRIGSKFAIRSVMAAMESDIRDAVFDAGPVAQVDVENLRTQFQSQGIQPLRRYRGESVLVASTETLKALVTSIASTDGTAVPFSRIVTGTDARQAALGLTLEAWLNGLALFLGVDRVLAGDDDIWNAGDAENGIALIKVPRQVEEATHKWEAMFGRVFLFLPDGVQPYSLEAHANMHLIDNEYTAKAWYDVLTLNSGAVRTWSLDAVS